MADPRVDRSSERRRVICAQERQHALLWFGARSLRPGPVDRAILKESLIRDQIRRGLIYGWYFLPAAPPPLDLQESIVDLRNLHAVPKTILTQLVSEGKRICRIQTPYREHLAQHFAVTYSRIGLPEPYGTQL